MLCKASSKYIMKLSFLKSSVTEEHMNLMNGPKINLLIGFLNVCVGCKWVTNTESQCLSHSIRSRIDEVDNERIIYV